MGRQKAREYYAEIPASKGGMRAEIFDTIAWDDTGRALEGRSKTYKMWYAKQGSGFCGVGYWTSKWEKKKETSREEEL